LRGLLGLTEVERFQVDVNGALRPWREQRTRQVRRVRRDGSRRSLTLGFTEPGALVDTPPAPPARRAAEQSLSGDLFSPGFPRRPRA
jgi:hypothetical protein